MGQKYVIALFDSVARADLALNVIHSAGFTADHVSYITRSDSEEFRDIEPADAKTAVLEHVKLTEHQRPSAPIFATTGAAIGGIVIAPFAIGTMLLPLIIVGPLVGAGAGALLGGLLEPAKPEARVENRNYADTLNHGGGLIVVSGNPVELRKAWDTFKTCDPLTLREWESDEEDEVEEH
jgi:hypothetical protein